MTSVTNSFPTPVAAKLTGITVDTLANWNKRGILVPTLAAGRRAERLYTFRDLVAIRVLVALRDRGIDLHSLRRVVDYVRKRKGLSATEALARTVLITDGHDVYEIDEATPPMSALRRPGQAAFYGVVLDTLVAELQRDTRAALKARAAA